MKPIPIGKDNFQKLIQENCYYVDKTKAIEEILESGFEVLLYTRPRRFGKSLFISMLENFFDIDKKEKNKDLFKDLYIFKSPYYKEFGNYPVIRLNFKDLKQNTYEEFFDWFELLIQRVYHEKYYVKEVLEDYELKIFERIINRTATRNDYENSIEYLSRWLERYHHKRVVVLIDEYDAPIQYSCNKGYYNELINFINNFLYFSFRCNDSLKFGVLIGVLEVYSTFSGDINALVFDMLSNDYKDSFGFTENETKELLEHYGLELTSEVKEYYQYNMNGINIYNPWNILNYARDKSLKSYWLNTSGNDLIIKLLSEISEENKIKIEKLLTGESIEFSYNKNIKYFNFDKEPDINRILNLMYMTGYLTIDKKVEDEFGYWNRFYLKIPNNEIKKLIIKIISFAEEDDSYRIRNGIDNFEDALLENKKEEMENNLNKMLESMSYMDTYENFYHGYMLGIFKDFLRGRKYIAKSNRKSGLGRFDVLIESVDRKRGYIFEFKIADNESDMENMAMEAKEQMKEKEYYKELQLDKVENIKEYALVFCGKKCIVR